MVILFTGKLVHHCPCAFGDYFILCFEVLLDVDVLVGVHFYLVVEAAGHNQIMRLLNLQFQITNLNPRLFQNLSLILSVSYVLVLSLEILL